MCLLEHKLRLNNQLIVLNIHKILLIYSKLVFLIKSVLPYNCALHCVMKETAVNLTEKCTGNFLQGQM